MPVEDLAAHLHETSELPSAEQVRAISDENVILIAGSICVVAAAEIVGCPV